MTIDDYIEAHSEPITAYEHWRTHKMMLPYTRSGGTPFAPRRVLDWGCLTGIDASRIKREFGDRVEVYGCDVFPPEYETAWKAIGMEYTKLTHPWRIPYPSGLFDTIISSGTMEHVPFESESLKELWRILRPNGRVIFTYLPRQHSVIEWVLRMTKGIHHKRRYTDAGFRRLLLQHGFIPRMSRAHHSTPMRGPRFLRKIWQIMAPIIERLIPAATQNLMVVAEKIYAIGGETSPNLNEAYGETWHWSKTP